MQQGHWEEVYKTRDVATVGWFESTPMTLPIVRAAWGAAHRSIIDVGAGASLLVDHLLDDGVADITLLDISKSGLDITRKRLGDRGNDVHYVVSDITEFTPARTWDIWHDRATFHFLTDPVQRVAYRKALSGALSATGTAILAVFSEGGPSQCAGLPVQRYSRESLQAEFAGELEMVECVEVRPESNDGTCHTDRRPYLIAQFRKNAAAMA